MRFCTNRVVTPCPTVDVLGVSRDPRVEPEDDGIVEPEDDGITEPEACTSWTHVGRIDDIPRLGSRVVKTAGADIAVFRTADDRVFALVDRCPHKQGKLSQVIVHGTSVTCPLHNWVIGLDDGAAKDPDEGCVNAIPVRLDGDTILLALSA